MPEEKQIKIKVKDEDIKGRYSNLMQVLHTKEEFILDFFLLSPPQGVLTSRLVVSPSHLKRMAAALKDNIEKYETKFGKIEVAEVSKESLGFKIEEK